MQHIPRIYVASQPAAGPLVISGDSAHHLIKVMRVEQGDEVRVFRGDGREWRGRVSGVDRGRVTLAIEDVTAHEPLPAVTTEVWCALVRTQRFDWMIEKVTEAGADIIRPFVSERTSGTREASKSRMERWQRLSIEAAEQSGSLRLPAIQPPAAFERLIEAYRGALAIGERDGMEWAEVQRLLPRTGHIAIAIGPEGGFSARELSLARAHGALPLRLGRNILRTETAALVGVSLLAIHASGNRSA